MIKKGSLGNGSERDVMTDRRLYYEDFAVGACQTFGRKLVEADEIISYARAFDPQVFHLDEVAAQQTRVGGLIASGFHSCGMLMRMFADEILNKAASHGSPGMNEVRWLEPVRPGDEISVRLTCRGKRPLSSKPGLGLVHFFIELVNQSDVVVMTWDCNVFIELTPAPSAAPAGT